jgi:hypothetical protein
MQLNDKSSLLYLYELIEMFIGGRVSSSEFCDLFYECFDLGIDLSLLSDVERSEFERISDVAGRFSEYEEDRKQFPKAYSDEDELQETVLSAASKLRQLNR